MAVLQLFKMLALSLVGLVAMTTASPIAIPTTNDVSVAANSCYPCMATFGRICQLSKLSTSQCQSLWCYSEQCHHCLGGLSCPKEQAVGANLAAGLPIATLTDVAVTVPSDVSIAIPADISGDIPSDVSTEVNCYRCVYINLFCKQIGLSEDQCFELRCKDPECYRCRQSCRETQQVNGYDSATVNSVVAESSPTSVAKAIKREEAKHCFWVCIHTYCTHQCIGRDTITALKASGALVIDEADMKTDTTISVTSNHAQLQKPFLYHCDWTSGVCWTDPIFQAVAGTDISIEEIPDISTKVCRELCSTDESLCGLICDVDENGDVEDGDIEKNDVAHRKFKCHWECMYGQCWTVCPPTMAAGSADTNADVVAASLKCRWECYFGQCHTCCIPSAKGDAVEKRGTSPPPCHERCDDDKCWIVCPRPPIE